MRSKGRDKAGGSFDKVRGRIKEKPAEPSPVISDARQKARIAN
jgi:hypothetical protein